LPVYSTDDDAGLEKTLIDACRRLTSTAVELTPGMGGLEMASLPRELGERDEKNEEGLMMAIDRDHRRRSISHSYQDITSDPDADVGLNKRIDHLSRYLNFMKFLTVKT